MKPVNRLDYFTRIMLSLGSFLGTFILLVAYYPEAAGVFFIVGATLTLVYYAFLTLGRVKDILPQNSHIGWFFVAFMAIYIIPFSSLFLFLLPQFKRNNENPT